MKRDAGRLRFFVSTSGPGASRGPLSCCFKTGAQQQARAPLRTVHGHGSQPAGRYHKTFITRESAKEQTTSRRSALTRSVVFEEFDHDPRFLRKQGVALPEDGS